MKSPLRKIQEKADKIWQVNGLEKKENRFCLVCGSLAQVLHHYIPKSVSSALRYCYLNAIPLCNKCHCRLHSSPDPEIVNIIRDRKGEKWLNSLREKRKQQVKPSIKYYQEIIDNLQDL